MRLPLAYVAALVVVAGIMAFTVLTATGLVPVESILLLVLNYVFQVFAVTVLAALGGVFLGMVFAHRMLATRAFTPFERELLATMRDVRGALERGQERDRELAERVERLEQAVRDRALPGQAPEQRLR